MQIPAQFQTVIQILDELTEIQSPADRLVAKTFKNNRYIGSKDKAAITSHLYAILRSQQKLDHLLNQKQLTPTGRARMLAHLALTKPLPLEDIFTGEQYQPAILNDAEQAFAAALPDLLKQELPEHIQLNLPQWLLPRLKKAYGDALPDLAAALGQNAPLDIRVNTRCTTKDELAEIIKNEGYDNAPTPFAPNGIRLARRAPLTSFQEFRQGHFEIQDEGSQLLAQISGAKAGDYVIDFCAGAGGKALALAEMMNNKGRLLACDIHGYKLLETKRRARRNNVSIIKTHELLPTGDKFIKRQKHKADIVFIDAPCTGTGTWRRNPDAKHRLTETDIKEITQIQTDILTRAARYVKPGGTLVYATCSLLPEENEHQAQKFTAANAADFTPTPILNPTTNKKAEHLHLAPHTTKTDGFFATTWTRNPLPEVKTEEKPTPK